MRRASAAPALVTGAAGFFGTAIVRALVESGVEVIATDRVDAAHFAPWRDTRDSGVTYVARDLTQDALDDLAGECRGVIHAGAVTPARDCDGEVLDAVLAVNVGGCVPALRAARRSRTCRRFIFISSSSVYDQTRARSLGEDDAGGCETLYGTAKLAMESVGQRYAADGGLEFCSVRPTSLAGAGESERPSRPAVTPFAQLVRANVAGQAARIDNMGSRADWLSVDDAANAVVGLWHAPSVGSGVFNLSSGKTRPFTDVVDAVGATMEQVAAAGDAGILIDAGPDRPAVIENARISALIGWKPRRGLEEIAREIAASQRSIGLG